MHSTHLEPKQLHMKRLFLPWLVLPWTNRRLLCPMIVAFLHFFLALIWADAPSFPTYYFLYFGAETLYWSTETTNYFSQYNATSLKKNPSSKSSKIQSNMEISISWFFCSHVHESLFQGTAIVIDPNGTAGDVSINPCTQSHITEVPIFFFPRA